MLITLLFFRDNASGVTYGAGWEVTLAILAYPEEGGKSEYHQTQCALQSILVSVET